MLNRRAPVSWTATFLQATESQLYPAVVTPHSGVLEMLSPAPTLPPVLVVLVRYLWFSVPLQPFGEQGRLTYALYLVSTEVPLKK